MGYCAWATMQIHYYTLHWVPFSGDTYDSAYEKDDSIWRSILGSPLHGNSHTELQSPTRFRVSVLERWHSAL